jgi:hypothetical protein
LAILLEPFPEALPRPRVRRMMIAGRLPLLSAYRGGARYAVVQAEVGSIDSLNIFTDSRNRKYLST